MVDDVCCDIDGIIQADLCERLFFEMLKDDPDESELNRIWSDLDALEPL